MRATTRWFGLALAGLGLLLPSLALGAENSWWNDEWDYRKEMLFDMTPAGAAVETDVDDAAVLLRLSGGNFAYFANTLEDGADIRFVAADDVTPLSFYIEKYDPVNEIALIWVRMPKLAIGGAIQSIYMYYGNGDAVPGSDSGAVFDATTRLALDFASPGIPTDLTAFGTNPLSATTEAVEEGLIGAAARFVDGTSEIVLPPSPGLAASSDGFTTSMWLRVVDPNVPQAIVLRQAGIDGSNAIEFGLREGYLYASFDQPEGAVVLQAATQPLIANTWFHVAMSIGLDESLLYVNGDIVARAATLERTFDGQWTVGDPTGQFVGDVDQFMMYATELSASRLRFAARNEAPFGTVTIAGDDARNESAGGHANYFAITMRNVTLDGWVVIAFLGVMFVISVWVMWIKGALLSKVERQNRRFMDRYGKLGADPLALDNRAGDMDPMAEESALDAGVEDDRSFHPSTLFPLYHAGAIEVKKRLAQQGHAVGAQSAGLSARNDLRRARLDRCSWHSPAPEAQ